MESNEQLEAKLKRHWKEHRRDLYLQLTKSGKLDELAREKVATAIEMLATNRRRGMDVQAAMEFLREDLFG